MANYKAYFDGGCGPSNPGGTACYGIVILKDDEVIHKDSVYVDKGPTMSSNVAEYCGFMGVLDYVKEHDIKEITIYGDSNLVVNQMNLKWKIKKGLYKEYAIKAKEMLSTMKNISIEWLPREENELADSLSKPMHSS